MPELRATLCGPRRWTGDLMRREMSVRALANFEVLVLESEDLKVRVEGGDL